MAGSLLALLDDIATLLDDVSAMSKVAAKKTAGVLGDDLAVNAEQVSGVSPARELPVVWAVARGSMLNKAIIVPLVLLLSAFLPALITPLLMAGGTFLCFEGAEAIWHWVRHKGQRDHSATSALMQDASADLAALEKAKIRGAIRTDFILSLEIIVISISTMTSMSLAMQAAALSVVAILMTVGVYGLVAIIVKLDDMGLHLVGGATLSALVGRFLLWLAPALMRSLSVVGTLAMLLVGGGILSHGLEHYLGEGASLAHWVSIGIGWVKVVVVNVVNGVLGLVVGLVVAIIVTKLSPGNPHGQGSDSHS